MFKNFPNLNVTFTKIRKITKIEFQQINISYFSVI